MELKYKRKRFLKMSTGVLIVPLWNWNNFGFLKIEKSNGFNRTFMELKYEPYTETKEIWVF